jgi:outer membrane protein W
MYFSKTVPSVTRVDGGFARVLQAGSEYKVSEGIGMFVDVKKELFTTTLHDAKLGAYLERHDPLAVTAGRSCHF